ncbi:sodium/potassium-transporting ATPase subunit beta-1-like [Onthophagus taurus]|uniref:sodium/potassium-transporting ATPase subunit beta-1-like n=1 Tax=Onthophagus taurus TaxID=166361 RepID=UPI000C20AEB3|nr:sodium/potassium-transporting ATPase subunit beta-1-like [Onthophagus taurus]
MAEKDKNGVHAFPYMKPPEQTTWEKISTTFYNKSDNTILGRTGKGWCKLLIFYGLFYIVLGAMFAICMQGLFATLDDTQPSWILDRSLIGTNPGMGFRPLPDRAEEGALIAFNSKDGTTADKYVNLLNVFLKDYMNDSLGTNREPCDFDKRPGEGKVCDVDMKQFMPCTPENGYGYNTSSPCIFLKLNRIFGWVPEYYNDIDNLPSDMPIDLVEHIKKEYAQDKRRANQVWVSCKGEKSVDEENINDGNTPNFEYYPRGFASYYYPFENVKNYLSPLIAVRVLNIKPSILVNIECRAWAKNIIYVGSYRDRRGSVHFELMRD